MSQDEYVPPVWDKLLWVDIETSGLDPVNDVILEVGVAVTDLQLNLLANRRWVRSMLQEDLNPVKTWDPIVLNMHTKSGLLVETILGGDSIPIILNDLTIFIQEYFPGATEAEPKDRPPLHGSSVHFDHQFLTEACRRLDDFYNIDRRISYRHVDVSTVKHIIQERMPDIYSRAPESRKAHRVLSDIEDSIAEYKYYLTSLGLMGDTEPFEPFEQAQADASAGYNVCKWCNHTYDNHLDVGDHRPCVAPGCRGCTQFVPQNGVTMTDVFREDQKRLGRFLPDEPVADVPIDPTILDHGDD